MAAAARAVDGGDSASSARAFDLLGVAQIDREGGDIGMLLLTALGLGKGFTLELVAAITDAFEEEIVGRSKWAYLARSTRRYTHSLRAAGKVVTRGRNALTRLDPSKKAELEAWAVALRAELKTIVALPGCPFG